MIHLLPHRCPWCRQEIRKVFFLNSSSHGLPRRNPGKQYSERQPLPVPGRLQRCHQQYRCEFLILRDKMTSWDWSYTWGSDDSGLVCILMGVFRLILYLWVRQWLQRFRHRPPNWGPRSLNLELEERTTNSAGLGQTGEVTHHRWRLLIE